MMKRKWPCLTAVALLAAIIWRLEVELHGWEGLDWISYFHWALPISILLFLCWLFAFSPFTTPVKRWAFVLAAGIAALLWFQVVDFALRWHFVEGRFVFALMVLNFLSEEEFGIYRNSIYAVIPLTPFVAAGLLWIFGLKPKFIPVALSVGIYLLACPASVGLLAWLPLRSFADAIHSIKSGVIIPFLIIGLGILVPGRAERPEKPDDPYSRGFAAGCSPLTLPACEPPHDAPMPTG
jgi:hypothetical protein